MPFKSILFLGYGMGAVLDFVGPESARDTLQRVMAPRLSGLILVEEGNRNLVRQLRNEGRSCAEMGRMLRISPFLAAQLCKDLEKEKSEISQN